MIADDIAACHPMCVGIARKILDQEADAEDAASDAIVRALRAVGRFPADCVNVRNWVSTFARRAALDLWRARRVRWRTQPQRRELDGTDTVEVLLCEDRADTTEGHERARRLAIERVLGRMRAQDAALLRRAFLAGESRQAIAAELGLKRKAYDVRLFRARRKFMAEWAA